MPKAQETLIHRYWSYVFNNPDRPHILVPNNGPDPETLLVPLSRLSALNVVPRTPSYHSLSFKESGERVGKIMEFLSQSGFRKGDRAAIVSWNRPEWLWSYLAVQSLGGINVGIYPNTSADQVNHVLKDAGCSWVFGEDSDQLSKITADLPLKKVVFDSCHGKAGLPKDVSYWTDIQKGKTPYNQLTRVIDQLAAPDQSRFLEVSLDDPASLVYTSGSTGVPKGAVITHRNIASELESISAHGINLSPEYDVYLSALPPAHIYEQVNGLCNAVWTGVPMAFCKVLDIGEVIGKVRPTVLLGVPAVWRKFKDKIESKLLAEKGIKSSIVKWAFHQTTPGFKHWLADRLVFKKVRDGLGGRLRIIMSGGAPISPEVLNFFNQVGLTLLQGYGLTETSGGLSVCTPEFNKVGSVGKVIDAVEIKIVPEPGASAAGDGEIWVRGDTIFQGYWNLPAETAKVFAEDGWFKTGDLGKLDHDYLYITGRKKRVFKTEGGKYVAPESIEKAFDGDPIVQYVVPVGDGKKFIGALIFVNQLTAQELLSKAGVQTTLSPSQISIHSAVMKAVKDAVDKANAKLEHHEQVKEFVILPDEAKVDNGLLTPTLKIRTEEVARRYSAVIDSIYREKKS